MLKRLFIPLGVPALVLAVLVGGLAGVGTYTFGYAEGLSYFSTRPEACANCHIMNQQYASWGKSGHHHVAGCVDCHLPHDLVGKYIAKAENGFHHSKAFTLQGFHEPIRITPKNARILQESCLRCHGEFVREILPRSRDAEDVIGCVHCHRGVGHGPPGWGE